MARYRIESDGSAAGTKVYDADTGERVRHVQSVTWQCGIDRPFAEVTVVTRSMSPINAEADAK